MKEKFLGTTSIYLFLQFLALILFLLIFYDKKNIIPIVLSLLIFSFLIEFIGAKTGIIFGNYHYSKIIQPNILSIPLPIVLSWFTLCTVAFIIISDVYHTKSKILKVILTGFFLVGLDIILEPFSALINKFWIWENNSIPFRNYFAWFITSLLISFVLSITINKKEFHKAKKSLNNFTPYIILFISLLQFLITNIHYEMYASTIIGLSLIIVIYFSGRIIKNI